MPTEAPHRVHDSEPELRLGAGDGSAQDTRLIVQGLDHTGDWSTQSVTLLTRPEARLIGMMLVGMNISLLSGRFGAEDFERLAVDLAGIDHSEWEASDASRRHTLFVAVGMMAERSGRQDS